MLDQKQRFLGSILGSIGFDSHAARDLIGGSDLQEILFIPANEALTGPIRATINYTPTRTRRPNEFMGNVRALAGCFNAAASPQWGWPSRLRAIRVNPGHPVSPIRGNCT